jgi:IS1 family transposase
VGCKEKNVTLDKIDRDGLVGDVWTWVAMDADTKLICSWMVGDRSSETAIPFIQDLSQRLANRVQLTTDGHRVYLNAVEYAFGSNIDYAMLVKLYGETSESEKRYSPAQCIGCKRDAISGAPDPKHISTSYIERQNLTMRMQMRRFTRLTNAFSKKIDNHVAAIAIHYMHYNFCRIHQTLRVTPAMAAGITDRLWVISDIVALLDQSA